MNLKNILLAITIGFAVAGCLKPKEGCTDPEAQNYDPTAQRNSLCVYGDAPTVIDTGGIVCDTCTTPKLQDVFISVVPVINGERVYLNKNYKDKQGRDLEFTFFKFYISNVLFGKPNFEKYQFADVELIDYDTSTFLSATRTLYDNVIEGQLAAGTYNRLYLGCGVDPVFNEEYRPNDYPADHPLNALYSGMDWTWESKYKFTSFEGSIDSDSNGVYDRAFFYHTGFSELYRQVILAPGNFEVKEGMNTFIELELDVLELFEGIDIATSEGQSHTSGAEQLENSRLVQTNLANNIKFKGVTYE